MTALTRRGAHRTPGLKQRLMAWNAEALTPQPLNWRALAGRTARWTAMPTTALFTGVGSIALHSTAMTLTGAAMYGLALIAGWVL